MTTLIISALLTGALAYLCLALVLARWADRVPEADERHEFRTRDGWTLTVHRFLPRGAPVSMRTPVILGHGLMMNRASWELSPQGSMIRALCDRGHDVFVAEYRGARSSRAPVARNTNAYWDYSIEDLVEHDLPTIIEGVCALTESERVNWVGHSLGGILIYLYAARSGCQRLGRVVTLGSPVVFSALAGPGPTAARGYRRLLPWRKVFRARMGLVAVLPLALLLPGIVLTLVLNSKNLDAQARLTLIRGSVEDISTRLLDWFLARVPAGETLSLVSADSVDGDVLASFEAPLLVVAGGRDLIAPPQAVRPAYEHASSAEKHYLLLDGTGELEGVPSFGHSDMPSSPAAVLHLVPIIANWLENHSEHREETDALVAS